MEGSMAQINHVEGEEEYVLLDLDDVCVRADIPANAPYVLSGLDTAKPVLVIGDLKLIGEYQETMGTCYIFSEDGAPTVTCSETKPSETNVFKDKQFLDSKQAPSKQVKPIASLHKILKFKLVSEDQNEMAEGRHSTWLPNIIDQRVEWNWKESNVALTVIRLDRSPATHVFFFMDMLPGWPPQCREAQPFLPDVMGGRKDKR